MSSDTNRAHEIWREIFYLGAVDSLRLANYLADLEKRIGLEPPSPSLNEEERK